MEPQVHEQMQETRHRQEMVRRNAGRVLGMMGVVCALFALFAVISATGLGLVEGTFGILFGVSGYMLGSRFFGNAAVVSCLIALFVVMVLGQNLL